MEHMHASEQFGFEQILVHGTCGVRGTYMQRFVAL